MTYRQFLNSRRLVQQCSGIEVNNSSFHPKLFDFQRDITRYALRKGRAAVFADTGLGKTYMQLEWARHIAQRTLIVAPLTVARQTVKQAKDIYIDVKYVRDQSEVTGDISITNYEMIGHLDPSAFGAVALDESSILKSLSGKTRQTLIDMFANTPYRSCYTATPAPNDIAEIGNHAEFLGIMTRTEMLAAFFVHDDQGWRLKKHAEEPFYRWLASWGMSVRKPSDLGYSDEGYILPDLNINPVFVDVDIHPSDRLFFDGLKGVTDRSQVRKATLKERVSAVVDLVNSSGEQWIVWCGLNDESNAVHKLIPDSVDVRGSQSPEEKMAAIEAFQDGSIRVLVTKPKIAGFGINLQNAHNMAFVGLSDSWESYYQCVRRCWRFGQTQPVNAHIVLSEAERAIYDNVMSKEQEARRMSDMLISNVQEYEKSEIGGVDTVFEYATKEVARDDYRLLMGDSSERLAEVADESVGLSVFSPPFVSLYTYSPTERDLGNSRSEEEFFNHFGYVIDHLLRITMPGRNCCVHVAQIPAMLVRDGYIGIKDFRGQTITAFESRGWIYHGEVTIDKDPQAQAIRTHSKALLFTQLHKDASWLRPALSDTILVFRKPGDNSEPIVPDLTNDEWIEWARPIWYGIRESDTLNIAEARENNDERHICPLQLGTIERCIRLWSNPGELVCSPFVGIGSEGYMAIKLGRRFVGCELKEKYFETACKNLANALRQQSQGMLFVMSEVA